MVRWTGGQVDSQTGGQWDSQTGGQSGTSEVVQDALGLSEGGLTLLCRLLSQSFGSVGTSQQLICRLSNRDNNTSHPDRGTSQIQNCSVS